MKLPIANTLLLVAILAYLVIGGVNSSMEKKEAYVVTGELYAQFEYQQELDFEFSEIKKTKEEQLTQYRNQLVGMENKIKADLATDEEIGEYQIGVGQYRAIENQVNEELASISTDFNTKIWEKLNAFVTEYGEANGYEVIFGADGGGNIMYAEDERNITEDLVTFCNDKYSGQ